jgi:protein TonB
LRATSHGPAPQQRLHPAAVALALAAHAAALAALVAFVQTAPRHKEATLILEAPASPQAAIQPAAEPSIARAPAPPETVLPVVPEQPAPLPAQAPAIPVPPPPVEAVPLRPAAPPRPPPVRAARPRVQPLALPAREKVAPPMPPSSQPASPAPAASAQSQGPATQPRPASAATAATIGADWRNELGAWLQAHKQYPDAARERGDEGRAVIRFTVSRDGRVLSYSLVSSSGSASLDEAAQDMFRGATLPPFPASMGESEITVTVPIHFTLER